MKILAISVGVERDVESATGETIRTAINKKPIDGPIMLRMRGLDGDVQSDAEVHGGFERAVLVYSWDNYSIWRQELSRDDMAYGEFGENFTVEGMLDDEICIGDVFRIGDALVEVSQPRIPCYKLAIKMGSDGF